jgi:hypothetical protein
MDDNQTFVWLDKWGIGEQNGRIEAPWYHRFVLRFCGESAGWYWCREYDSPDGRRVQNHFHEFADGGFYFSAKVSVESC